MTDLFNDAYAGPASSPTLRRVQRAVYGDEYPDEAEPYSLVTRSDLRRIAQDLGVGPGQSFVDLACGAGGPGMWVARETGAAVIGIDLSAVAIRQAVARAEAFGVAGRVQFRVGDVVATGLPAHGQDGAMSIDALWVVPDKGTALREVARLLRPGARFIFTTWDFGVSPDDEPQVADHHPLLDAAGFDVEAYEETAGWARDFQALVTGYEAARDQLAAEFGEQGADDLLAHHRRRAALLPQWQRILVIARRR